MTFNIFSAGQKILSAAIMQNFRHLNFGSPLMPVDSNGSSVDNTIDLGSSTYRFKDGNFGGKMIVEGGQLTVGGDKVGQAAIAKPAINWFVYGNSGSGGVVPYTTTKKFRAYSNDSHSVITGIVMEVTVGMHSQASDGGPGNEMMKKSIFTLYNSQLSYPGAVYGIHEQVVSNYYQYSDQIGLAVTDGGSTGADFNLTLTCSGYRQYWWSMEVKITSTQGYVEDIT